MMIEWRPDPDMWAGRTVVVLAGGPSLTAKHVRCVKESEKDLVLIAINNSWQLVPEAHMLYAADRDWWRAHSNALQFEGMKIVAQPLLEFEDVWYCKPRGIGAGGNSALRACHVASDAGAARILLLGVDLDISRLTHWHGNHDPKLRNPTVNSFIRARKAWETFAKDPGRPEVINCSTYTTLTCFPRRSIVEFV